MPLTTSSRLRMVLVVVLCLILGSTGTAFADPKAPTTTPPNEGGNQTMATLRANLESASIGYVDAQARLNDSKTKQAALQEQLTKAQLDIDRLRAGVGKYAAEAYRTGKLRLIGVIISGATRDDFMEKAMAVDRLTQRDQAAMQVFLDEERKIKLFKDSIDALVAQQAAAEAEMAKRKTAAEKALAAVGGTPVRTDIDWSTLPTANPVGRNPDGTFPSESCSEDDPTTSGCLTPRTYYMYNETRRLGYDRYTSCYRPPGEPYEHPKGRACDWAATYGGFVNASASGANKVYGDRLSSFFAKNANAFGVMYVVWYCQIWHPATGWVRYKSAGSRCGDDPAGDHTNHVHVSIL